MSITLIRQPRHNQRDMESDASRTLELGLRDGTVSVRVCDSLINNDVRAGAVLAMVLTVLSKRLDVELETCQVGPLVQFLEAGTYAGEYIDHLPSADVYAAEVACYAVASGVIHIPGLINDIERSLYHRLAVTRTETVDAVRARFAGYDRIDAMCNLLDQLMPTIPTCITHDELKDALKAEGGLFIFHGDKYMTFVYDNYNGGSSNGGFYSVPLDAASNPSYKQFQSFIATRYNSVAPFVTAYPGVQKSMIDSPDVLLSSFHDPDDAHAWKQIGVDGTDMPLFPPLHTIDAVVGMTYMALDDYERFVFARNDLWQFAYDCVENIRRYDGHVTYDKGNVVDSDEDEEGW